MRTRCGLALSAVLLLLGCEREVEPQRETLFVFGGEAEIDIQGADPAAAQHALAALSERFNTLHREWHAWESSPLTELNAHLARGERSTPPASIRELIQRSQTLSIKSDGLFDPAIGGLMKLWGFHTSTFPVTSPMPDKTQIEAWRQQRPSIADVVVEGESVYSHNPAVELDFGGIAEGVAAEQAAQLLSEHGIRNVLLTLGGDVYALGDGGGRPWRVGIRDPYGGVLAGVDLHDHEALFSSGNYNKFREAPSGARWAHVLDPQTGMPVQGSAAVAVLHRDPVLADIAATTLMIGGPARFAELTDALGVRCALLLTDENELVITVAMDARVQLQREPVRLGAPTGTAGPCSP